MSRHRTVLFVLNAFILSSLVLSQVASGFNPRTAAASPLERAMQAAGVHAPLSGDAADVGLVVAGPQIRAGMDSPPPADKAVVSDARIPVWETRYNTMAGLDSMDPQGPPPGLSAQGAAIPVSGWRSYNFGNATPTRGIAAADDGRVFVGTAGDGLKVFYHNPNGTNAWTTIYASAGGLVSNSISDVGISGNLLWVGTAGFGISVMNLTTNTWSTYTTSNSTLPSNSINRVNAIPSVAGAEEFYVGTASGAWWWITDPWNGPGTSTYLAGNNVTQATYQVINGTRVEWFATSTQLWRYNGSTWTQITGSGACSLSSAFAMTEDYQGGMWFAAYAVGPGRPEKTDGVPPSTGEASAAPSEPAAPEQLPIPGDPASTSGDAPTAAFPIGVCRYFLGGWTLYTTTTPGLPSNWALDLRTDTDGRIWMAFPYYGGSNGGAAVWDQGTWLIFRKQYGDPLLTDQVNSVTPAGEAVWFGYSDLNAVTQYSNNWASFGSAATGGTGAVTSIFIDSAETYVGRGSGIVYHNGTSWISRPIAGNSSPISRMARLNNLLNNLWVATRGSGIYEYDGSSFIPHTTAEGLPSDDVRDLVVDQSFRLWAATAGGLALRTNGYWLNFDTGNSPLGSNDLTAVTAGNDGKVFIGTNGDGVYVLDPGAEAGANGAPPGSPAWTHLTSADGLPGNIITGFAVQPNGNVWASGPGGAASRNAATGVWTIITPTFITAIASDPSGRIWLGTKDGLWRYAGGVWKVFRTNSALLDSNLIVAVAADGLRTWAASGGNVQARADFNGPIGFFVPVVSSFSPSSGGVDDIITINGSGFDDRERTNSVVSFGNLSDPYTYGDIQTVTPNQMTVKLPLMALTGKITVRANRLNGVSAANFTVLPRIKLITPGCAALGGELTVIGSGFNSGNQAAYIKIGGGPWRFSDAQTPTSLRYRLRPGDTDGTVSVRLGVSGTVITSVSTVTIDSPVIDQVGIQQAIQGMPLVWAKRTLILLSMRSTRGMCSTRIDSGQLEFKLKNGSTLLDWQSFQPTAAGLTIGPVAPPLGVNTSVSFVMWSQELSRPSFSVTEFDGVRLHLFSGPVEVVTYDIPVGSFFFTDLNGQRQFLNAYMYDTTNASNSAWDAFYRNANKGLDHVARVYPQSDLGAYYGSSKWMTWAWRTIGRTALIDLSSDDTFHDLQEQMEDIRTSANDNGGSYDQGMAVIEDSLRIGNTTGKATYNCSKIIGDCDQSSAVAFNTTDSLAGTFMQEAIHTMHWIQDSSPNHDGSNETHSKYNNLMGGNCTPAITFRQALVDQLGYAARAVRIEQGKAPYQFLYADCSSAQMPTSVMSYAPGSADNNTFLEPLDFFYVFNNVKIFGRPGTPQAGGDFFSRLSGLFGGRDQPATHQELRLNGQISGTPPHTVTISMSYLGNPGGTLTQATPGGPFQLDFRDGSGASLAVFPFDVGSVHTHGLPEKDFNFGLRVPFPDATATVAMVHEGQDIWTSTVSAGAPTVGFTSPVQYQSYNADTPLPVTWNSSDPEGDTLSFILEYSADNGVTWQTIATGLSGASFDWTPMFPPVGTSRLRITASDGYNTGQDVSPEFYIQPTNPVAIIQSPADGTQILEGEQIAILGDSIASDDGNPVQYDWYYDGNYFASGQSQGVSVTEIGLHTIGLQVIANGLPSAMTTITFEVIPDYDRDGLSNAYEQAWGINPLDRSDSAADPDGDGLQSLVEQRTGTSPTNPDSDYDTVSDGDELAMGGLPNDPSVTPPATPVLQVGADALGFDYVQGDALPGDWSVWVTNGGGGTLDWTAQSSAPWLSATSAGSAPAEMLISADPTGLPPGVYHAMLTVNAPGAAGSPKTVNVFLRVYDVEGNLAGKIFLPLVRK